MKKLALVLMLPFLLWGCGGYKISADRPTTKNIVVLGDSITAGYGVEMGERYTQLLQFRLRSDRYVIKNLGVTGDTTAQGLARIEEVIAAEPEIVIVALGGNDFIQGKPLTEVAANLREIIKQVQTTKADVLLVGVIAPPTRGLGYSLEAKKMFKEVAEDMNVVLMPNFLKGILLDQRYMLDQVHPNAAGHQILSDNMWEYLQPMVRWQ